MNKEQLEKENKELLDMIFELLLPQLVITPFSKTSFDYYQLEYDIKVKSEHIRYLEHVNNRDSNKS